MRPEKYDFFSKLREYLERLRQEALSQKLLPEACDEDHSVFTTGVMYSLAPDPNTITPIFNLDGSVSFENGIGAKEDASAVLAGLADGTLKLQVSTGLNPVHVCLPGQTLESLVGYTVTKRFLIHVNKLKQRLA